MILREPGGTAVSEKIRAIILDPDNAAITPDCELILYVASRAQLVGEVIRPALSEGKLVICDRFMDSTLAYQGFGRGLGAGKVEALNSFAVGECVPDLTIFLDLKPEDAFKRKGGADKGDRLELEGLEFHNKVYEGYRYAAGHSEGRIASIYPTGTAEDTHGKIINLLKERGFIR